jgi:hypothetical protein
MEMETYLKPFKMKKKNPQDKNTSDPTVWARSMTNPNHRLPFSLAANVRKRLTSE